MPLVREFDPALQFFWNIKHLSAYLRIKYRRLLWVIVFTLSGLFRVFVVMLTTRYIAVRGQTRGELGFRLFPGYYVRVPPRPLNLHADVKFGRMPPSPHLCLHDVTGFAAVKSGRVPTIATLRHGCAVQVHDVTMTS